MARTTTKWLHNNVRMCFQFSPKHCQPQNRCNITRKTVPYSLGLTVCECLQNVSVGDSAGGNYQEIVVNYLRRLLAVSTDCLVASCDAFTHRSAVFGDLPVIIYDQESQDNYFMSLTLTLIFDL